MSLDPNTNWLALYEQECHLMGMDRLPLQRDPRAEGLDPEYAKFPYAVITPESENTPDEDCFVLILMGDGFTPEDMDKWHYYAQQFTRVVLTYPPLAEFTKNIKFFRVDAVSNERGVSGDDSSDGRYKKKDTYFGGHVWLMGMQRLGGGNDALRIATGNAYCPKNTDSSKIIMYNTTAYGASGGGYTNLSWANIDVTIHETSHNIALIPDEYLYSGTGQLDACKASWKNSLEVVYRDYFFNKNFQKWNPWVRLLGRNGTKLHPFYEGRPTTPEYLNLFRPVEACKMRFVGSNQVYDRTQKEEFGFCELCKEVWRSTLCLLSHNPQLQFQPYNDMFYDNAPVLLNRENFLIRLPENPETGRLRYCKKVFAEDLTGDEADNQGVAGAFTMTVSSCMGDGSLCTLYENVPVDTPLTLPAGTYRVDAVFTGTYHGKPCVLTLPEKGDRTFTVREYTPVYSLGSYEDLEVFPYLPEGDDRAEIHNYGELWQDRYNEAILSKPYDGCPVELPRINLRKDADPSKLHLIYSWHLQNFDGSRGTILGVPGIGTNVYIPGPSGVGKYVLHLVIDADPEDPVYGGGHFELDYPFSIDTPFHPADFYPVDGGRYSHELVSNDYRIITITGEGFTEMEQPKFEEKAKAFIQAFINTYPINNVPERFGFYIENTMSADSGIAGPDSAKDTFYGFCLKADGSIGTYRSDKGMDDILFEEVWRRDTNTKTNAQWGATLVILNDDSADSIYNYRHPECNRAVVLTTAADPGYRRAIEALGTQFAHMRSNKEPDLLDRVHWMEGPEKNFDVEELRDRLIESCYSHEVYAHRGNDNNLPRPVVASRLAGTVLQLSDPALKQTVEDSFFAYSYGHELVKNTGENDTFSFHYYADDSGCVGKKLPGLPDQPGTYWVEAIFPRGEKYFAKTETDRYGYTYKAGDPLPGINGRIEWEKQRWTGEMGWTPGCNERGIGESAPVRGFIRLTLE
ncbi:MAG: hypothetical protein J5865_05895 [Lachnospiraceae bacterium]|nr:hypothetical protein [Lachnospiraceae bacterium]